MRCLGIDVLVGAELPAGPGIEAVRANDALLIPAREDAYVPNIPFPENPVTVIAAGDLAAESIFVCHGFLPPARRPEFPQSIPQDAQV